MKRVSIEKDKINKYIDSESSAVRHEGPLSEGEDRDDYTSNDNKTVDREAYAGKWAEKGEGGGDGSSSKNNIPAETNAEEMDRFLSKVKKEKKDEMLERNKDLLKNKT